MPICVLLCFLKCWLNPLFQMQPIRSLDKEKYKWNATKKPSLIAGCFLFQQRPERQTCCGSLLRDTHWKCLVLSVIIWVCLSFVMWCQIDTRQQVVANYFHHVSSSRRVQNSSCENGYVYIPLAFAVMFYLIYLVECWNCHTRLELTHKIDSSIVYEHIKRMQESMPFVWWKVVCYHYVRRTRQVMRYRNGDAFTSTQVLLTFT